MGNLELFPSDHSTSANFVRLDFETAIADIEHVRLLSEDAWQQTDYSPAQKASICCGVAPIEKGVLLLRMAMNITVNPNLSFFDLSIILEHQLGVVDLRLKILLWVNPLSV